MIQERLLVMVVGAKVSVSDAEVRRLYDQRFKKGGTQVHLVTLRMPYPMGATQEQKEETKQKAETIMNAVKRGESFAEAAGETIPQAFGCGVCVLRATWTRGWPNSWTN